MAIPNKKPEPAGDAVASALRTLGTERDGIAVLMNGLGGALGTAFTAAVDLLASAKGRVIVTGMGKSGHIGRKIAATLASTGTPAYYVHPGEASHGDLGMVQPDDVIVALSWSGETAELADLVAYAKRFRLGLIAVTCNEASSLARQADACLILPKALEACPNGLAPTTSTTMQLVIGDALAVALLERRGFTAEHFRVFHPGGKLGAQLKLVREVMHTGERLPLVPVGTRMAQALTVQSEKSFGCVIVVALRRFTCRHRHRRRSPPAHERRSARSLGRGRDDARPHHHRARPAPGGGAGDHRDPQERRAHRPRGQAPGRARALPRSLAGRRRVTSIRHSGAAKRNPEPASKLDPCHPVVGSGFSPSASPGMTRVC